MSPWFPKTIGIGLNIFDTWFTWCSFIVHGILIPILIPPIYTFHFQGTFEGATPESELEPPGGHLADPQLDLGRKHQGELTKTAESELQACALLIDENISRSPG